MQPAAAEIVNGAGNDGGPVLRQRRWMLLAAAAAAVSACGGGGSSGDSSPSPSPSPAGGSPSTSPPSAAATKSTKRGIAYDLVSAADYAALAPGVSWWYDWSDAPHGGTVDDLRSRYSMDFVPMLWNQNFDDAQITQMLLAHPQIRYLLAVNEPNLTDQANRTPQQAAELWPRIEKIAQDTAVKIVGPQMTWGTMPGYSDPVVWMDAFVAAYRAANGGRDPGFDYLGFHWYDYGLAAQLDRLAKYGKPFWVTEMANWHQGDGSAAIDTVEKQMTQMTEMVALCEARADVFRYAWFTGRWADEATRHTSLLGADGQLTALGQHYLSLPG